MTQNYGYAYNTYPVWSEEYGPEGSMKRFTHFPTPKEVYSFVMLGLPKHAALTGEPITVDMVVPYLESALTEIEMKTGMNVSEVQHFHSEDFINGMFVNNLSGIRLQNWPATQIIKLSIKYPHTNTTRPYQEYTVPAKWVVLRRNRINVVASDGAVSVNTDNSALGTEGVFSMLTGFNRGNYGPAAIEVVYKAGWQQDKLPSAVADLIKTWAGLRFLTDMLPILFPNSSVSVAIDGVSQSAGLQIQALIGDRLKALREKRDELLYSITSSQGRQIKLSILGS